MSISEHLSGTENAPLAATRSYDFRKVIAASGHPRLLIPVVHRNSYDDFGEVERSEQQVFLERLIAELGVSRTTGYPGEWIFADATALDTVWNALRDRLRAPSASVPLADAHRDVPTADAARVSAALAPKFLELVSAVAGPSGEPFTCVDKRIDTGGPESKRKEVWRSGEVWVGVEATAIESGYGVHGEHCQLTVTCMLGDGRDVRASARLDMRSGGSVDVTVSGVLDAKELAERFLASL